MSSNGQAFKPGTQETASYVSNLLGVQRRSASRENRPRQQRLSLQFRFDAGVLRDRLVRDEPLPRVLLLQGDE